MRVFGLSLLIILIHAPLADIAQAVDKNGLISLQSCIEIAIERNLGLIQASLRKKAATSQAKVAFKDMLPKLSTQYSYIGMRDAQTITIFDQSARISSHDSYAWDLALIQPIFQGGVLWNRYKVAKLNVDFSEKQVEQVKNDLIRQVKKAYYNKLKTNKLREEAQAAAKRLESHLKDAQGFYQVGLIAKNDVLQSKVELAQAKQDLIAATHEVELARARLNLLLRQDLGTELHLDENLLQFTPYEEDLNKLQAKADTLRPEIQAGLLSVDKFRNELKVVESGYWPKVDLTVAYEKRGNTPDMSNNPYGDCDNARLMVTASWELWAWGQTRDQVTAASYNVLNAEAALQDVRDSVAFEVNEAWLRLKEAEAYIKVVLASLDHARENFRLNTDRYKEQIATSTDVLDAQALLTEAKTRYFRAIAVHLTAKARLEYAVGHNNLF